MFDKVTSMSLKIWGKIKRCDYGLWITVKFLVIGFGIQGLE